jgi:hypothetical protein
MSDFNMDASLLLDSIDLRINGIDEKIVMLNFNVATCEDKLKNPNLSNREIDDCCSELRKFTKAMVVLEEEEKELTQRREAVLLSFW